MISFKCLWCGQDFKAPDAMAGKKVKCKKCGSPVDVPRPGAQEPARQAPVQNRPSGGGGGEPFANLGAPEPGEGYRGRGNTLPGMLVGLLGSVVLAWAVVQPPVLSVSSTDQKFTFWQLGTGIITLEQFKSDEFDVNKLKIRDQHLSISGAVVMFMAILAFLFSLARASGMLWFCVIVSLASIGFTVGRMQLLLHQIKTEPDKVPAGDFCLGLANSLLPQARNVTGGWVAIGAGLVLLIVGAILISFGRSRRRYMG
jgi:hypothetical protein